MAVEKLERSQIRAWIYERLRQGKTGSLDLQLSDLGLYVRGKAITAGLLEQRPFEANHDIPQPIADLVRETAWELTFQGILVPGVGIGAATGDPGFPFFQISEWGKSSLDSGEYLPYDATQFVDRLTKKITGIDPIILLYITEALISFRCGGYLSSAVMVGVAAERALLLLRAAIESSLDTKKRQEDFASDTSARTIKRVYDEIWKRLDPHLELISAALKREDITAELSGIFDLIRKTRNDAGHPTGRRVEREEAFALLQLFPTYCSTTYAVIDWLTKNAI
jgi:hypothetical protein